MRRILYIIIPLMCLSCIKNNIPYPIEELYITSIEGDGFTMRNPNNAERTIVLDLDEATLMSDVTISKVSYSPNRDFDKSIDMIGSFDMRIPLQVTLSLYQDYVWTISAEQNIERYFKVDGQIGKEEIDVENQTITAYVSKSVDLQNVKVKELKLGPEQISTYDTELEDLTQFISYRTVDVTYHDITERWRLYVEPTDVVVQISQINMRVNRAEVTAVGDTSAESFGVAYRKAGDQDWIEVAAEDIEVGSGVFTATINELTDNTEYEFKAYLGDAETETIADVTETILTLPNSDFEQWSFPSVYNGLKNKSWFPFLEGGEQFWASGNQGATTIGEQYNLSTPTDDVPSQSKGVKAASLDSEWVISKFAAGSIFTGTYLKTDIPNGVIGLGRPFTSRPEALTLWAKYECGVVDRVGTVPPGVEMIAGQSLDQGSVFIALGVWDAEKYGWSAKGEKLGTDTIPVVVDTGNSETFFDKHGEDVVAYGELIFEQSVDEWSEYTISLEYFDTQTKPTHIIIVCSSSRYGDYFTGSTNSKLFVDDLSLEW